MNKNETNISDETLSSWNIQGINRRSFCIRFSVGLACSQEIVRGSQLTGRSQLLGESQLTGGSLTYRGKPNLQGEANFQGEA